MPVNSGLSNTINFGVNRKRLCENGEEGGELEETHVIDSVHSG